MKALFQRMCDRLWDRIGPKLKFGDLPDPDFISYPDKFPTAKKEMYLKKIIGQLAGDKIPKDWKGTVMVKSGEQYTDTHEVKPD